MNRKYLPTLSELIDRLSIVQLKEVFIPDHKSEYADEIADIVHDIQAHIDENNAVIDAEVIRAIVVLSQMNLHIWHNESNYRKGVKDGNSLELTHGLNGIRNTTKNQIQNQIQRPSLHSKTNTNTKSQCQLSRPEKSNLSNL